MSSIEVPIELSEQTCGRRVLELNIRLLYWQGLWYEDPEPDLEFYLQYFSPRLAHLLVRHRSLRVALRFFRTLYPRSLLAIFLTNIILTCPTIMYDNWGINSNVFFGVFYLLCTNVISFISILAALLRKKLSRDIILGMENCFNVDTLNNDDQAQFYIKAQTFCHNITSFVHVCIAPIFAVAILSTCVFVSLPNRQPILIEVYPLNTTSSPMYEVVLFTRGFQIVATLCTVNSLAVSAYGSFVQLRACFGVLINKIENIRSYSMEVLRGRKVGATMQVEGVTPAIEQQVSTCREEDVIVGRAEGFGSYDHLSMDREVYPLGYLPCGSVMEESYPGIERVDPEVNRADNPTLWNPQDGVNRRVILVAGQGESVDDFANEEGDEGRRAEGFQREHENKLHEGEVTAEELDKEMRFQLGKIVKLHQEVLRATQSFGVFANEIWIMLWLLNVVILGITLLFMQHVDAIGTVEVVQTIISIELMAVFFMINYEANLITDQAAAVGEAIYACDWLVASPSFKRSLLLIMTRANRPLVFKPTGLDPLSRKNFAQVSNLAYKMLATLESVVK